LAKKLAPSLPNKPLEDPEARAADDPNEKDVGHGVAPDDEGRVVAADELGPGIDAFWAEPWPKRPLGIDGAVPTPVESCGLGGEAFKKFDVLESKADI